MSTPTGSPQEPGRPPIRVGHAERQTVVDQLAVALDDGRLDLGEYDERVRRAYAARTAPELSALTTDLIAAPLPAPTQPSVYARAPSGQHPGSGRVLRAVWAAWATAVAINVVIWAIVSVSSGELIYFWPIWVAGPWGAVLLVRTLASRPH